MQVTLKKDRGYVFVRPGTTVRFLVDKTQVSFTTRTLAHDYVEVDVSSLKKKQLLRADVYKTLRIPSCPREVKLVYGGMKFGEGRIRIELGEYIEQLADIQDQRKILFKVKLYKETNFSIRIDGENKTSGLLPPGTSLKWVGEKEIDVTIGDAGNVDVYINDRLYRLGKKGESVRKLIRWEPDQKETSGYSIVVKDVE
jgi:hypothetical protein